MIDFDALLKTATPPEEVVPICLDGALVRRYEEMKERIEERAANEPAPDLADVRLTTKTRRKPDPEQPALDALAEEVRSKTVPFLLRAMSRDRFTEFMANPALKARTDGKGEIDARDARLGYNADEIVPALIKASIADPDVSAGERWDRLVTVLSDAQQVKLFNRAWSVNREDRDVPFSLGSSPSQVSSVPG